MKNHDLPPDQLAADCLSYEYASIAYTCPEPISFCGTASPAMWEKEVERS